MVVGSNQELNRVVNAVKNIGANRVSWIIEMREKKEGEYRNRKTVFNYKIYKNNCYFHAGVESTSVSALWFIVMAIGAGGLKRRINFSLGTNRRKFVEVLFL